MRRCGDRVAEVQAHRIGREGAGPAVWALAWRGVSLEASATWCRVGLSVRPGGIHFGTRGVEGPHRDCAGWRSPQPMAKTLPRRHSRPSCEVRPQHEADRQAARQALRGYRLRPAKQPRTTAATTEQVSVTNLETASPTEPGRARSPVSGRPVCQSLWVRPGFGRRFPRLLLRLPPAYDLLTRPRPCIARRWKPEAIGEEPVHDHGR